MILSELSDHKEICDVIIFGSVAGLKTKFNQEMPIPHHVDLVHYESISNKDLIDHIDRVGISIC